MASGGKWWVVVENGCVWYIVTNDSEWYLVMVVNRAAVRFIIHTIWHMKMGYFIWYIDILSKKKLSTHENAY